LWLFTDVLRKIPRCVTPKILGPMIRERLERPLFIIDAAVPRDVAPEVIEMDGVFLYDIDALQSIAEQSLALRRLQIAPADATIAEHVADFRACYGDASLQLASAA